MKKRYVLLLLLPFFMSDIAEATEPYNFITDVIRSFERLKIAADRIKNADNSDTVLFMKNTIVFNNEINFAAQLVKPHVSSNNNIIKESASGFYEIYLSIIKSNQVDISLFESALNNPKDTAANQGTFMRKFSENMALNEELWRGLVDATTLSTYTLVDDQRTDNGKLTYLTITSKEKESVMHQLVEVYGESIKNGAQGGQLPLEFSGGLLYYFLNQGHKPSDTK